MTYQGLPWLSASSQAPVTGVPALPTLPALAQGVEDKIKKLLQHPDLIVCTGFPMCTQIGNLQPLSVLFELGSQLSLANRVFLEGQFTSYRDCRVTKC